MPHSKNAGYRKGDNWASCSVCGFDYRASEFRRRWDGLMVCREDWEPQHPQDFLRATREDTRPRVVSGPKDEFDLMPNFPGCVDFAVETASGSMTITWPAEPRATFYHVRVFPMGAPMIEPMVTADTAYIWEGLTPGVEYMVMVNAGNENGVGSTGLATSGQGRPNCDGMGVTTDPPPCPGLSQPEDEEVTATTVTLVWTAITGADEYKVYLNDVLVTTTAGLSYEVSGLTPGTVYEWTVHSVIAGVESSGCGSFTFETQPAACPELLSPGPGEAVEDPETFTWAAVPEADAYRIYIWPVGEDMPETPTAETDSVTLEYEVTGLDDGSQYNWVVHSVINGVESSGCASQTFTTAYVCGLPATGSYLISPAWNATYPTLYTASCPQSVDSVTGVITFVTNQSVYGEGDPDPAPLTIPVPFDRTTWTHEGQPLTADDLEITIGRPQNANIWGPGYQLRRLDAEVTPVQFFPTPLFVVARSGYSNLGGSGWETGGWATIAGYLGDWESYSPTGPATPAPVPPDPPNRGNSIKANRAKYFNGKIYVQQSSGGSPSTGGDNIYVFSAPGGALTQTGTTYGNEPAYQDPVASRDFGSGTADITYDPTTGKLYVMLQNGSPTPYNVTIYEVNPTTLATVNTWVRNDYFQSPISGFTVRGTRVVLTSDGSAGAEPRFWIMELGAGSIDTVFVGVNLIDPGNSKTGAYVWADPLCGWLKQKDRWISPVIGP